MGGLRTPEIPREQMVLGERHLEKACHSRLDLTGLTQGQTPSHSTIADFVNRHGKLLRKLFRDTFRVVRKTDLVRIAHVAIDGSKMKADAGKKTVRGKVKIRSWQTRWGAKTAALEQE